MSFNLKDGGTWRTAATLWVKIAGTWQACNSAWVKVAGTWQQVYAAISYALSGETGINHTVVSPNDAIVGVRINNDGTIDKLTGTTYTQINAATDYIIPNSADKTALRFRAADNNANLEAGSDATGSWLAAPCEWYIVATSEVKALDLDIELSIDAGVSIYDFGGYTGTATSTV